MGTGTSCVQLSVRFSSMGIQRLIIFGARVKLKEIMFLFIFIVFLCIFYTLGYFVLFFETGTTTHFVE